MAALSDGVGEDGESRKIRGSGEKREVMSDAKSSTDACASPAVLSAHHVSELSLDLWARSAVAAFPVGIALTFSLAVEDVVLRMGADDTAARRISALCTQ